MHTVSLRDAGETRREAGFRASFPSPPAPASAPESQAEPVESARFTTSRRPNLGAIGAVALIHAGLFAALIQMNVIPIKKTPVAPLVVDLIAEPPPPPAAPPEQEVAPVNPVQPVIVSPPPLVRTPAPAPPVVSAPAPPPPTVVVSAKPAPAPAPPVSAGDLSSTMIAFKAPRYPVECRRRKEQGVVLLGLVLAPDGTVAEISVRKSSGFDRLDRAALDAVRHWRWSPTVRGGEAMMVRGVVEIPFVLRT